MADVGLNQTVRLDEDDPRIGTFDDHSAFGRTSPHYIEDETPAGHDPRHDVVVQTAPTLFDRTSRDDVDRVQHELAVQLAGVVDDHCLRAVLGHRAVRAEDVAPGDLDAWIARSVLDVRTETRTDCGVDVLLDIELDAFVTQKHEDGEWEVDLGWLRCQVVGMARGGSLSDAVHVVVAKQHVLGLSSRVALFYASHLLGDAEYLSARCELAYAPRLDFHPGAVRVARVRFGDEAAWLEAVRARRRPD